MDITTSELIQALEDARIQPDEGGAYTTAEMMEAWNLSDKTVRRYVGKLIASGAWERAGKVPRVSLLTGYPIRVPGYRPTS